MLVEPACWQEIAPAKLNLALHVRGKLSDGRHALETVFAFCAEGDRLSGTSADGLTLSITGPFAENLPADDGNLVMRAARALQERAGIRAGAALTLDKRLPVASGIGGGSADAAAALRLLTSLWRLDPDIASVVAPALGSDVPACLLSMTCRGEHAGDSLRLLNDPDVAGTPVLLVNPREPLSTRAVFAGWSGVDGGPLEDWRSGRNDLEAPARALVPAIADVLRWLDRQSGLKLVRMSGSGATCFGLFESDTARDEATVQCPAEWWHLATSLR